MATALFFRTLPADNDFRQDGADFRPGFETFQMVPTNGTRRGEIRTDGGVVKIASANENIVKIAPGPNLPAVKTITFSNPTFAGTFTLLGGPSAGNTVVVAEDEKGKRLSFLRVSVKEQVTVRYNLLRLTDAIHNETMDLQRATSILKNVEQLYLSQTNVRLTLQTASEFFVQRNLSDNKGVIQLDEVFDNKEIVIFGEVMSQKFGNADVVFVFTWLIEGGFGLPVTTGRKLLGRTERAIIRNGPTICYINTFGKGPFSHPFTVAHELGHHFGLSHLDTRPSNYLGAAAADGFKMTQDDINLVNRTGT